VNVNCHQLLKQDETEQAVNYITRQHRTIDDSMVNSFRLSPHTIYYITILCCKVTKTQITEIRIRNILSAFCI